MSGLVDSSLVSLADAVGADVAALRLMLSVLLSYLLVAFYNLWLVRTPIAIKHSFFISAGLGLIYFNYGRDIIHSIIVIVTTWAAMRSLGGTQLMVSLVFLYTMGYLIVGYWVTQHSDFYSFTWTIPQCVLTLRLIAVAFDYYDGVKQLKRQSKNSSVVGDQTTENGNKTAAPNGESRPEGAEVSLRVNETSLEKCPSLVEMFSMSYFPASVMVGPQIHMKVVMDYARDTTNRLPLTTIPALTRLSVGLIYLAAFQIGTQYWDVDFLTSPTFLQSESFIQKATWLAIVVRIQTCKYLSTWLISEGSCILSGITLDPKTGSTDSMTQAQVLLYETTATFGGMIRSFNITTNHWAAKYVFKRMRWAGSKFVSHITTLFFLALWHGWHTGYYWTFGVEFLIMKAEWEVIPKIKAYRAVYPTFDSVMNLLYWPLEVVGHIYVIYMWGYCLIGFLLFSSDKYLPVYQSLYWAGHLIYITLIVAAQLIPNPAKIKSKPKTN